MANDPDGCRVVDEVASRVSDEAEGEAKRSSDRSKQWAVESLQVHERISEMPGTQVRGVRSVRCPDRSDSDGDDASSREYE